MKIKFTIIKLNPDFSTNDSEHMNKIIEPVIMPETMETNSLTELKNSGYPSSPLVAKTGNYQLPSVKKIPKENLIQ